MSRARHVARTGEGEKRVNMNGRDHLEFLGVAGRIILKWFIKKSVGKAWAALNWLRIWTMVGSREIGDELSSYIKCW